MDVRAARELFPVTRDLIWLNHAGYSPPSELVRDAMIDAARMISDGRFKIRSFVELGDKITQNAALLVGAVPERVAIVRNTTHGILLAANGLSWQEGDNVVIADVEFPANVYPWLNLESQGVEIRFASETEGRIRVEDVARLVDERTRVVSLSFVEFTNGYRNDLGAVGELCASTGALFVVDAVQGLGALRFDMSTTAVDVACAGGHKWLAGPMGIGIAAFSERAFSEIRPAFVGWLGVRNPEDFLSYDLTFADDARRFDEGSPNLVGMCGLSAALQLIADVGIDAIEQRIKELSDALIDGLTDAGCRIASPRGEGEWSGIVTFAPPGGGSADLHASLRANGIVTSPRGDLVRAACHYYNDESDIEGATAAVADWIEGAAGNS